MQGLCGWRLSVRVALAGQILDHSTTLIFYYAVMAALLRINFQRSFKYLHGHANTADFLSYLRSLLPDSGYVICPGISNYPFNLRFKTKHLHEWGEPFNRLDSDTCELWRVPNNSRQLPSNELYNVCKSCKQLSHDIQQLVKRNSTITGAQRQSRTMPSHNYACKHPRQPTATCLSH